MDYLGMRAASSSVYYQFATMSAAGGNIAPLSAFEATDIRIYKNGSATERSSQSGFTMTSPFDSVVGLHQITIDLSDNTDAGFYAAGGFYEVALVPDTETIDSQTVNVPLFCFDIGVQPANVTQWNSTAVATPATAGIPDINVKNIDNDAASASGTVTFPNATLASTANITAGTITTATNVSTISAGAIVASSFGAGAIDAAAIAADAIGASELATGAIDEILNSTIGDGTLTVRQALRISVAALSAKLSGAAGTTVTIRNVADSQDVIVATVDSDGNRSATTVTP